MNFNSDIERAISPSRMSTYRDHASDDEGAWKLYRWNVELSSSLVPLVADIEVTLRNTLNDRLAVHFDRDDWWTTPSLVLDDQTVGMLGKIVKKHQKQMTAGSVGPGKVVAGTTLGVWVNLLGRGGHSALGRAIDYEAKLWRPALRFGFSKGTYARTGRERRPTRDDVHRRASELQVLRNRLAHHEPIFNGLRRDRPVPLLETWKHSVELLEWMCPDLATLHRAENRTPKIFGQGPPLTR